MMNGQPQRLEHRSGLFVDPIKLRRVVMENEERVAEKSVRDLELSMPRDSAMTWDEQCALESADRKHRHLMNRERPIHPQDEPIIGEHRRRRDNALVGWGD